MGLRSSVITQLPYTVRTELDRRLIENGFSRYLELVAWLKAQGFDISKGALNRYGIKLERRHLAGQATKEQTRDLLETASAENRMTPALLTLLQERIFLHLVDSEGSFKTTELRRLASIILALGQTDLAYRRWMLDAQDRLDQQRRAALAEVDQMKRGRGLPESTVDLFRQILMGLDPFPPNPPAVAPPDESSFS